MTPAVDPFSEFNPDQIPPLPEGRYTFSSAGHGPMAAPLYSCDLCGAAVINRTQHAKWHWSLHLTTVQACFHYHPPEFDRPMVDPDLYSDHLTAIGSEPPEPQQETAP